MFLTQIAKSTFRFCIKVTIASIVAPVLFPIIGTVGWETQYTYANEYRELTPIYSETQSLALTSPKNSFTVELETESTIEDEEAVKFSISAGGITKEVSLELEGDEAATGRYLTAPSHFESTSQIQISCTGCETLKNPKFHIIALDSRSSTEKLIYKPDALIKDTHAAVSAFSVVSRSEWGADEGLRYADSPIWKSILERNATYIPSAAAKKQIAKDAAITAHLEEKFPEDFETNEVIRSEDGHPLVWEIEKAKNVRKIVLHHTAEENTKSLSDAELMRSMYYYHAITRGWGDIGYQYVVGQRGQIYEGRAGGDYVVGAHTSWNNRGTVGVSVIGNFEKNVLVKEQTAALKKFLDVLVKKYGINTNTIVYGHKACKVDEVCLTNDFQIPSIVGHRDVGYTSCPGGNLYNDLKVTFAPLLAESSKNEKLIANAVYKPETLSQTSAVVDASTKTAGSTTKTTGSSTGISTSDTQNLGPSIRIKLSVPAELKKIDLSAVEGTPVLGFGKKSGATKFPNISLRKLGNSVQLTSGGKKYKSSVISLSADVVRVNNWIRIPAWDKDKQYNDNEFRGKIEARIENGKLILINELPLELYLRGLAEFSNGENEQKAKTILVAARSYANFYINPKNRKFPGKPYDGSDDPDVFQKYLGYGYEKRSPTSLTYIQSTVGQIITHKDVGVKPWYFNQSSGRTLSALEYCQARKARKELSASAVCEDIPYLQSVSDPGSEGKTTLGHGVGISGAGASYFANSQGWDYEKIIKYYLTGVEIEKIY